MNQASVNGGETTKKATAGEPFQELISCTRKRELVELFGKLEWDDDYDYERERNRR